MNTCPVCAVIVAESAASCPQCGYDQVNRRYLSLTPEEERALQAKLAAGRAQWQARQRQPVKLELPRLVLADIPPLTPPSLPDCPPLPPLSAEVTRLEAQLAGMEQALRVLQAGEHPILAQGAAVLQAAEQLAQQAEADYRQQRQALSTPNAQVLEAALGKNPETDWGALYLLAPEMLATQLYGLVTAWRQQYQTQAQWAALQAQWSEHRLALEGLLQGRCTQLREALLTAQRQDFAQIVAQFLAKRPQAEWMAVWVTLEAGLMQRRYRFFSKPGELFLLALPGQNPAPAPKPAPVQPSPLTPQDIHGWNTAQVQTLQREVAAALGIPVERPGDPVKGIPALILIPPGKYLMGSPANEPERRGNEGDAKGLPHPVTISQPFYLGKYAVTRGEFRRFIVATKHRMEGGIWYWTGSEWKQDPNRNWENPGFTQTDAHPVVGVSWQDAQAYAGWLTEQTGQQYRLPSEAEWEYACRAGTTTAFWWGNSITPAQANYGGTVAYNNGATGEYRQRTVEVHQFAANPWGLYQMHGNVWEWVQDRWHGNYSGAPPDGSAWETNGSTASRVLRGGSWGNAPGGLRSANRDFNDPDNRNFYYGFRLVLAARTLL